MLSSYLINLYDISKLFVVWFYDGSTLIKSRKLTLIPNLTPMNYDLREWSKNEKELYGNIRLQHALAFGLFSETLYCVDFCGRSSHNIWNDAMYDMKEGIYSWKEKLDN